MIGAVRPRGNGASHSLDPGAHPDSVDILLVDDRPEDLTALTNLLADPGYRLVTAPTGAEALRRVLEQDFAVILLDVMMPGMDGFEVASLLKRRERSRYTPILFMTAAHQEASAIYRAYSAGAVDYLVKPIEQAVVRAKVEIFADLYRKDRRILEQARALHEADLRQRELELAEMRLLSEKRYRNLVESIPAAVWTSDATGGVEYCSHNWYALTGMRQEEVQGNGWLSAVHGDDRVRVEAGWREAVAGAAEYETELRLLRSDGTYRWHLCHAVPENDRRGQARGWLGVFADCQELKNAVESRDRFLSIASHELRTPLNALQLYSESLARSARGTGADELIPNLTSKLNGIQRQVERMTRLIEQLLDVSRIMAGKLAYEPAPMDLGELSSEVAEGCRDAARTAGCTIDLRIEPRVCGSWDRSRLDQVLTNLLVNAIKFGAGKPVEITVEGGEEMARLTVRDHGIGIALEDQARIFERFERAVSPQKFGGFGLGLWIVRQVVAAHGGKVMVKSHPGEGATFAVELPRRVVTADQLPTASAEGTP